MQTVPFSISDAYEGLADVEGLARFEDDVLHLEFQTTDAFFGVLKSGINTVRLTLANLESARFSKSMFRATLTLRVRSMSLIDAIPGARRGEIKLRFARKYRDDAHTFATQLQLRMSERRLDRLDEEMRKLEAPDD
ncbi:MAG: hypothetical protein ACE5G0_18220 [Rhodothermales bacterium]